jgi:hypothetical protein
MLELAERWNVAGACRSLVGRRPTQCRSQRMQAVVIYLLPSSD